MPEPLTAILTATPLVKPSLDALSQLIRALKEPLGNRKIQAMQKEFSDAFEELEGTLSTVQVQLEQQNRAIKALQVQVAYLRQPWWKRWFGPQPSFDLEPAKTVQDAKTFTY